MQQTVSAKTSINSFDTEESVKSQNSVRTHKWTRKEYYKMAELGFFAGKRVELIEGEIIEMSPMKTAHAVAVRIFLEILSEVFGKEFIIDSQLPMSFSPRNEPEPDVAVVKGNIRDFLVSHPKTAELIVEISDTTLGYDRDVKAKLYAQNKIQDYWILNLKKRCLEVYRQPKKTKNLGWHYAEKLIFGESDKVSPLAAPKAKIKVADLLP